MKRRSLAEIRERAERELRRNSSITVYTFVNGVERRRPANPMLRLHAMIEGMVESIAALGVVFEDAGRQLGKSLKALL